MTAKKLSELDKLLDEIQTSLVELFEQVRELRRVLGRTPDDEASGFTPAAPQTARPTGIISDTTSSVVEPVGSPSATPTPIEQRGDAQVEPTTQEDVPTGNADATVARVLDPIAHELRSGNAPAEVLAEYVQAAKEYLIAGRSPNEKVSRDMDVVLKFLRSRGGKPIRPEERDNILQRVRRWKLHLSAGSVSSST